MLCLNRNFQIVIDIRKKKCGLEAVSIRSRSFDAVRSLCGCIFDGTLRLCLEYGRKIVEIIV